MKYNSTIQRHCTHLISETEENKRKLIAILYKSIEAFSDDLFIQ